MADMINYFLAHDFTRLFFDKLVKHLGEKIFGLIFTKGYLVVLKREVVIREYHEFFNGGDGFCHGWVSFLSFY